eukprot:CAMPEP_0171312218 /NCGR_PEP_ID=MMETSP0816-20121228/22531_1 /TAXON_ID=420281 /ORGANISM="Proboscia inermis, Strain CCAP1064/1" /LENGTH=136 /DNA_ID=CAMNT_0011797509 /DNA_START=79 /DNA_END=489 /DNA_ORIENTATION=-
MAPIRSLLLICLVHVPKSAAFCLERRAFRTDATGILSSPHHSNRSVLFSSFENDEYDEDERYPTTRSDDVMEDSVFNAALEALTESDLSVHPMMNPNNDVSDLRSVSGVAGLYEPPIDIQVYAEVYKDLKLQVDTE